jgi:hypothetical protein
MALARVRYRQLRGCRLGLAPDAVRRAGDNNARVIGHAADMGMRGRWRGKLGPSQNRLYGKSGPLPVGEQAWKVGLLQTNKLFRIGSADCHAPAIADTVLAAMSGAAVTELADGSCCGVDCAVGCTGSAAYDTLRWIATW